MGQQLYRLIQKNDYRQFEYRVNPENETHYFIIRDFFPRLERYFKDRPQVQAERKIYSSNSNRYYTITFADLAEARMFELHFAEHIRTNGTRYD
tara:strand:+ start:150 stop:431 length:282 start_codon:yes stop_codon:yes gene_type:complete